MADDDMEGPAMAARPASPWLKAVLLGSAILLSGMVIGGVATYGVLSKGRLADPSPAEHTPIRIVERIRHDLDLRDDQAKAVIDIFTRHHERMETVRMKVQPEVEAEMEAARKEVEAVLTPEQRPKWNKRCQEMRERFRPRPGGGH